MGQEELEALVELIRQPKDKILAIYRLPKINREEFAKACKAKSADLILGEEDASGDFLDAIEASRFPIHEQGLVLHAVCISRECGHVFKDGAWNLRIHPIPRTFSWDISDRCQECMGKINPLLEKAGFKLVP